MTTHTIEIKPGQDERMDNNGFYCAELLFILRDGDSAATFGVRTNWPPATMTSGFIRPAEPIKPLDLAFHFPAPTLTATQERRESCPFIANACHSVFDRKNGERLCSVLLSEGSVGLWRELEKLFNDEARINRPRGDHGN